MSRRVLLLPGTKWQIEIAKKIKELGHELYVIDPSESAACIKYADLYLKSDIYDQNRIAKFIDANPIDAVISDECDIATPIIARIADELDLPTIGKEMARLYTDKYMMREFCKENGYDYPEYCFCQSTDQVVDFYRTIGNKIIVKPLDSNASKGVVTVNSIEEAEYAYNEAVKYSKISKGVIAERYINGTEFTVDGIKTASGYYVLGISEKKHFSHNENISNELYFTYSNPKYDYDEIRRINAEFVMKSELPFGLTHAEYKFEDGKFYLIEIAARGGGNELSSIIMPFLTGRDDLYECVIESYLGNVSNEVFTVNDDIKERAAVLKFFDTPNKGGIVSSIEGADYLENSKEIYAYGFNFKVGDTIEECVSDSARIGYYIACCKSEDRLKNLMNEVENTVNIRVKDC